MYEKAVLDNGLRIVTQEMPHTYSASLALFFRVGSRYEPDSLAGVSHVVEHMLFKGTSKRPTAKEISEAIEEVGGVMNAATEKEVTTYWVKVTADHRWLGLDLLADIALNSTFQLEELEKERRVIVEEIHMANDVPAELVHMLIDQIMWPDHPLGRDIAGTDRSVEGLQLENVLRFYGQHYAPNNVVVAVAGAIRHADVVEACKCHFGAWVPRPGKAYEPAPRADGRGERVRLHYKDTEQLHLCVSGTGLPRDHPDRRAQDLQNLILGGGMSSRLFLQIREQQALAYDVHAYVEHYHDAGASVVYAGTDPERTGECVAAVLRELARMRDEPVPESELRKAKENFKGRMLLGLEDSASVTNWLGGQEALNGKILGVEQVTAELDAVQPADIQRVARMCLGHEALQLAIVGPFRDEAALTAMLDGV